MHNKMQLLNLKNFEYMIWEDECYLLSKRKFRRMLILLIFLHKRRKVRWYCLWRYFKKSKKLPSDFNKLFVSHTSKSENRIGYFKTELIKPISPLYFNDKERTSALISICSILNILLPDSQPNKKFTILLKNL